MARLTFTFTGLTMAKIFVLLVFWFLTVGGAFSALMLQQFDKEFGLISRGYPVWCMATINTMPLILFMISGVLTYKACNKC